MGSGHKRDLSGWDPGRGEAGGEVAVGRALNKEQSTVWPVHAVARGRPQGCSWGGRVPGAVPRKVPPGTQGRTCQLHAFPGPANILLVHLPRARACGGVTDGTWDLGLCGATESGSHEDG